jgi:hypothetical protein
MVFGFPQIRQDRGVCEPCLMGKQHRDGFSKDSAWRASKPLELVHCDICGAMKTLCMNGSRYFLAFIDDFSRKT